MRVLVLALGLLLMSSACSGGDSQLPAPYRDLRVPSQRIGSAAARENGRRLFLEHCAICHGRTGDGHGVRHEDLSPRPPDFTSAAWRAAATPGRVHDTIRDGRRGTAMPAWRTLTDAQIWDLTAYVLSIAEGKP